MSTVSRLRSVLTPIRKSSYCNWERVWSSRYIISGISGFAAGLACRIFAGTSARSRSCPMSGTAFRSVLTEYEPQINWAPDHLAALRRPRDREDVHDVARRAAAQPLGG